MANKPERSPVSSAGTCLGGQHWTVMSLERSRSPAAYARAGCCAVARRIQCSRFLRDVGFGITHATSQTLAAGNRVHLPGPAAGCGGSSTRCCRNIAARPTVTRSKRNALSASTKTAPDPQLPAMPVTVPVVSVRVRRTVPPTIASRRGRTVSGGACRRNSPASSTNSQAMASGASTCT